MDRMEHYLSVIGRTQAGVSTAQVQDELRQISARLGQQYPDSHARWSAHVRPLRAEIVGTSETTLMALLAASGAVLLIACLNVAGLLLGRATGRTREIGVRSALGATRVRLVRQLIAESVLLAGLGGALGVLVAYAALDALLAFAPSDTPRLHMISVDRVVLAYTVAATAITALLFGVAPAIQLVRTDVAPSLRSGRGTAGSDQQRLRRALVVAEVALAFVLVVTGGLLLKSFSSLIRIDPGFRSNHVLTAGVNLPRARYRDVAAAAAFYDRLRERVRTLPGVTEAGLGSDLPWTGYEENTGFGIVGRQFPNGEGPEARYHFVTPGFIHAIGLPLRAGRDISSADRADAPLVILINEATARRYWGEPQKAVGAQVMIWGDKPSTVVGIIGNLKDVPWGETEPGGVYFPQAQRFFAPDMYIAIRTQAADPATLVEPLQQAVRELDPELPISAVRTLDQVAGAAFATRRFSLALVAAFALSALFLAIVGVYGVMAQVVGQRVREFGVRQALGAQPADILRLVLSGGVVMGVAGLVLGIALALPLTRLVRSLLFRTSPSDPVTLIAVAVLLMLATLAASYIPARRAMRGDVAGILRQE
jgi:predicted permease